MNRKLIISGLLVCFVVIALLVYAATQTITDYGIKYDNDAPYIEVGTNIPFTIWEKDVGGLGANIYSDYDTAITVTDATGTWYIAQSNAAIYDEDAGVAGIRQT